MNEIVDRIWISGLEAVNDLSYLQTRNIKSVISIGCIPERIDEDITYHSFPELIDSPECCLLHVVDSTTSIIADFMKNNSLSNILVHCRYGQSRSASIIIAYLMTTGIELESALLLLKSKHTSICINPGFLCQLKILSQQHIYAVEYLLLTFKPSLPYISNDFSSLNNIKKVAQYSCSQCRHELATNQDELILSDNKDFLIKYLDSFWVGYVPLSSSTCKRFPIGGYKILRPLKWIVDQIVTTCSFGSLKCVHCQNELGYWQQQGLLICGGYIQSYLFAINESSITRTRIRKRLMEG